MADAPVPTPEPHPHGLRAPTMGHLLDGDAPRGYWVLGHRGHRSSQTGNTIEAFDAAVGAGADGIEFDVRRTRDNHWISFHDKTYHSEGRRRYIASLDLEDLRMRHTKLESVLEWADRNPRAIIDLEIKDPGHEDRLAEILGPHRDHVIITSFIPDVLWALNKVDPGFFTGYLAMHGGPFALEIARMAGCNFVVWRDEFVTQSLVEATVRRGMRILVWDVTSRRRTRELIGWGVHGFITDEIEKLVSPQARPRAPPSRSTRPRTAL